MKRTDGSPFPAELKIFVSASQLQQIHLVVHESRIPSALVVYPEVKAFRNVYPLISPSRTLGNPFRPQYVSVINT